MKIEQSFITLAVESEAEALYLVQTLEGQEHYEIVTDGFSLTAPGGFKFHAVIETGALIVASGVRSGWCVRVDFLAVSPRAQPEPATSARDAAAGQARLSKIIWVCSCGRESWTTGLHDVRCGACGRWIVADALESQGEAFFESKYNALHRLVFGATGYLKDGGPDLAHSFSELTDEIKRLQEHDRDFEMDDGS